MPDLTITEIESPERVNPVSLQLGEACARFDIVYALSSQYYKADATTVAKAKAAYILLNGGGANAYVVGLPLEGTLKLVGAAMTAAEQYVVSANGGKIAPRSDLTSGQYVTDLAIASTAEEAKFALNASEVPVP